MTALVALGSVALLLLFDPRTLPWLAGQIGGAWSAAVAFFSSLFGR